MFSVVIATRDRVSHLRSAIAALAEQTVPPTAVIVVDDGSTDGTGDWLATLDLGSLVVTTTEGVGVSEARNRGLELVETPWLIFLDDDDIPEPTWLAELTDLVDDGVGIVSCAARYRRGSRDWIKPPTEHAGVDGKALFLTGAYAVSADLMREAGGFLSGLTYAENTELSMRLLQVCERRHLRIRHSDNPLITVIQHDQRRSKIGRHHALLRVIDAHPTAFGASDTRRARWLAVAGVDAFRAGEHGLARRIFVQAFRAEPTARAGARLLLALLPPLGRRVWSDVIPDLDAGQ